MRGCNSLLLRASDDNMDHKDIVIITGDNLPSLDTVAQLVHDNSAGAIATFSGCTRDTFEGASVETQMNASAQFS